MRIDLVKIKRKRAPEQCSGGLSYGGSMAGMLELSNLDLQCTIRRNKNTGEERKERRTHRTRAPRTRGSRGDPARAGSGDRRRRSSEKRLRLLGEEKRTPDEIGERGGVQPLFKGRGMT